MLYSVSEVATEEREDEEEDEEEDSGDEEEEEEEAAENSNIPGEWTVLCSFWLRLLLRSDSRKEGRKEGRNWLLFLSSSSLLLMVSD